MGGGKFMKANISFTRICKIAFPFVLGILFIIFQLITLKNKLWVIEKIDVFFFIIGLGYIILSVSQISYKQYYLIELFFSYIAFALVMECKFHLTSVSEIFLYIILPILMFVYFFIFNDMRNITNLKYILFLLIPYWLMNFFYRTESVLSFLIPKDGFFYETWSGVFIMMIVSVLFFFLNFLIVFYGLLYFNRLLHRVYDNILSKIK